MKGNNFVHSNKNELLTTIQIINLCIGIILTLICVFAYTTIKSLLIKYIFMVVLIFMGIICFISLLKKTIRKNSLSSENIINTIALINENNDIIKEWMIGENISFIIGKKTAENDVNIDLASSIYSSLIEYEHAVLNYSGGKWYVEDLCSKSGVSIQKIEDGKKYKIMKYSPCTIRKGDILFIGNTKLLLR